MNTGNKSDPFDESGLNFELNAAIESNPFSKRKNLLNKDKTDNPPATQTTQVPEKKTYPAYSVQKPTTTTVTQERTFEYKKPATTEQTNVTNTQPEKSAVTGVSSTYQKGAYTSSYTRPEVQKTSVPVSTTATINKNAALSQDEKPPVMTSTTNPVSRLGTSTTTTPPVTTSTTSQIASSTTRLGTTSTTSQVEKPPVTSTTTTGVSGTAGIRPTTSTIGQGGPPKFSSTTSSTINRPAPTTTYTPVQTTTTTTANPVQQTQQKPAEELKYNPVTYERPVVNRESANTVGLPQTGTTGLRTSTSSLIAKSESDKPTATYTPNPLKNYSPLTTQKTAGGVGAGSTPNRPLPTTTTTPSKTTPTISGNKPAININTIPRNILTSRNNNRGLMIVNGKTERNQTRDIQANYLGHLLEGVASYPGPFKFEKKAMAEKHGELLGFIQRKLSDVNLSIMIRLCFTVLNEYLSNHSTSLFKDTAEQSRETICNEILQYSDVTLSNLTKEYREYFNISNDYLIGMGDLAFQDASWEDVLFKSLFLRNTTFNIDSTNVDFVLNYVRNKYAPGDPLHTFSMVKLGFLHEIFETPFFNENSIADIWPVLIYPCLKFNSYLPVSSIIDFFNSLSLKIAEGKNPTENSLLALFIALLTGDFDGETFNKICQNSRHPVFAQIVESYYFTLKASEANFDKSYNMIFLILPPTLSYTSYLLDLGAFDKAKEYLDYLISLRPFYQSLERDNKFLHRIRAVRDLVINHYTIIEEVKEALTQGKFLANKKEEIKQTAQQAVQKIQEKGKSLFGFVNNARNAFSSFMAAGGEEQEARKPAEQQNTLQQALSPLTTMESKSIVPPQQRPVTNVPPAVNKGKIIEEEKPPVSLPATADMGMVEDQGGEKPDSAKLKGAVASPFGNPGAGAKTTATGIKKIPQNRYVSPF